MELGASSAATSVNFCCYIGIELSPDLLFDRQYEPHNVQDRGRRVAIRRLGP